MQNKEGYAIEQMILYNSGDPRRIEHSLKVYAYAKAIAQCEDTDEKTSQIVGYSSIFHDIGIRNSELKYGSASGYHQQVEGPPVARQLLELLSVEPDIIDRVCYLVAHHHTYSGIEGNDYQILIESDFLVNIREGQMEQPEIASIQNHHFKTRTGITFLNSLQMNLPE